MFNVDQLRLQIEALIGEYPDLADDEMLRADMLEAETDFKSVLRKLYTQNDDAIGEVRTLTEQINDRKLRRERFKRHIEFYRELMLRVLQSADLKKVVLAEATLSQLAGRPQLIGEPDANALPDELCIIQREPDRTKIREALLNGGIVPGLSISNGPPTLRIGK